MAQGVTVNAPADAWTQITLASGVVSFRIQNGSFSVPVRMAIGASQPASNAGTIVIAPDPLGQAVTDAYDCEDGDSVWVKPADHSGLTASVTVVPIAPAA